MLGVDSYDALVGGSGSGNVNRQYEVSIYEGLRQAGFTFDEEQTARYLDYVKGEKSKQGEQYFWVVPVIPELAISQEQAQRLAEENEACVFTIGRMAGEGDDRRLEKGDYYLSDLEMENLQHLCHAFHAKKKPVVVLLSMGSFVDMTTWQTLPDAILHTWLSGQEAGNAIADVLTGKVSPSGKLPFTIAAHYEDYPSATNFPQSDGNPAKVAYEEGIYVGYRHFDRSHTTPLYPFGFGLSYTSFKYGKPQFALKGDTLTFQLTITNTGKAAGKEIVQLYASAPQGTLDKPTKELKAFAKTRTLQPSESETLTLSVPRSLLASYNEATQQWTLDSGTYTFLLGASSTDIRQKVNWKM